MSQLPSTSKNVYSVTITKNVLNFLCNLCMVDDPSCLTSQAEEEYKNFLNLCSEKFGETTWIDFYPYPQRSSLDKIEVHIEEMVFATILVLYEKHGELTNVNVDPIAQANFVESVFKNIEPSDVPFVQLYSALVVKN